MDKRIFGFVFAGGTATILNYGIFLTLLNSSVNYTLAAGAGYVSGVMVSYLINRFFVFRHSKRANFLKYLFAYFVALAAQLTLLNLLVLLGLPPELANAIAIAVVVILNFFLVRKIAF
jgi:putative flippase GtrA